jgi:hypothetical protein
MPHTSIRRRAVVTLVAALAVLGASATSASASFGTAQVWSGIGYYGDRGTAFADVTGDGKADAIVVNGSDVVVRASQGSQVNGGFAGNVLWTPAAPVAGVRQVSFADVDHDRLADAIFVEDGGIEIMRSTGGGFAAPRTWLAGDRATAFADVTGRGYADAIAVANRRVFVRVSNGNNFQAAEWWSTVPFDFGNRDTVFADVTGDGRADAVYVNDNGIVVQMSLGALPAGRFAPALPWAGPFYGSVKTAIADVTGDGRADAIAVNANQIVVRQSVTSPGPAGHEFAPNSIWSFTPFSGSRDTTFADVTGDGRADAIAVNDDNILVRPAA